MKINEILKVTEVFAGLTASELKEVAGMSRAQTCNAGDVIFEEGTEGNELYVLSEGRVSIEIRILKDTVTEQIYQIKDNEVFGEFSLIDRHKRSARTKALDNISLVAVDCDALRTAMDKNHHMGYVIMGNLARILSRKLRDTNLSLRNSLMQQKYIFGEFS